MGEWMSGGAIVRTPREDLVYSLFVHFSSSLLLLLAMEFIESRKLERVNVERLYVYEESRE